MFILAFGSQSQHAFCPEHICSPQSKISQNQYKYANLEHKYNPSPTRTKKERRANRRSRNEKSHNNGSQQADDNPALNIAQASVVQIQILTTTINSLAANMFAVYRHWRGLRPPCVGDYSEDPLTFSVQLAGINKRFQISTCNVRRCIKWLLIQPEF